MSRPVAVVFCPGRGSYGKDELGFLGRHLRPGPVADALRAADDDRRRAGRPPISELDAAASFRPGLHLDGENAAGLIYFGTLLHLGQLTADFEITAVAGNSLGWYTALAAASALSPVEGWRLVSTMARLQKNVSGGQVLTTTVDGSWQRDPEACAAVQEALDSTNQEGGDHLVARSIRLGGHEVLAGTDRGIRRLLEALPAAKVDGRAFPFQLAGHGPFHTELCQSTAEQAVDELGDLPVGAPATSLIDGRGNIHSPWSTDPAKLLRYTLTTQVTTTFDFTAAVRTAIREFNPDVLLCLGPGTSLRAPIGHVVIQQGYHGIRDKEKLFGTELVAAPRDGIG